MQLYFLALLALSVAAVIEARSNVPGLRPPSALGDRLFLVLGRAAFLAWLALLAWGFWRLHWSQPVAGLVGSLALNTLVLRGGARRAWPALSEALAIAGLAMALIVVLA